MYTFVDFVEQPKRLEEILDLLRKQGIIVKYEVLENRNQVRIEPFNDRSFFTVGVILGQFPEIKKIYIDRFNKQK